MAVKWYENPWQRAKRLKETTGYPDGKPLKKNLPVVIESSNETPLKVKVGRGPRWGRQKY